MCQATPLLLPPSRDCRQCRGRPHRHASHARLWARLRWAAPPLREGQGCACLGTVRSIRHRFRGEAPDGAPTTLSTRSASATTSHPASQASWQPNQRRVGSILVRENVTTTEDGEDQGVFPHSLEVLLMAKDAGILSRLRLPANIA